MVKNLKEKPRKHELQFNISQLLKEATGATRTYDINSTLLNKLAEDVTLVTPITGQVKFLRTGSDILVTATLEVEIQKSCGRCLTPFNANVVFELEEQFFPTVDVATGSALPQPPDDVDEANRIDEQHTLDLLEVIRQGVLLETEGFRYCRSDCKGLCPQCGQDRNIDPCTCEEEKIDSRWAGLLTQQLED